MNPKGSPDAMWASRYRRSAVPTMGSDDESEEISGFPNESINLPEVPRDTSVTRYLDLHDRPPTPEVGETFVLCPSSRALMTDPR